MREKEIEEKLVNAVKGIGGLCFKFTSPGNAGVPDRLALLPKEKIAFVEVKAPGENLRPLQEKRKREIENLGFKVFVLDDPKDIGGIIHEIQAL